MKQTQRDKIQKDVYKIVNRVKKNGRQSEYIRVKIDLMLKGQPAINYKVLKLFASATTDADLISILFRLGIKSGTDTLKTVASQNEIHI